MIKIIKDIFIYLKLIESTDIYSLNDFKYKKIKEPSVLIEQR